MSHPKKQYRTWLEIDTKKLRTNVSEFLSRIPSKTRFMAVIKSNAYGHGIVGIAKTISRMKIRQKSRIWLGVDSVVEALRLRNEGIRLPILVLGYILPERLNDAAKKNISVTVSSFPTLYMLKRIKRLISIHLKFDTGMHRQGFFAKDVRKILVMLKKNPHICLEGIYTHFASVHGLDGKRYTEEQFKDFCKIMHEIKKEHPRVITHVSSTGATLLYPHMHLDMVRIGIGMYGYFPSDELQRLYKTRINLQPILQWKSIISEIKEVPRGSAVGYDRTEILTKKIRLAIVPIGYWHGFDRGFSSKGLVLIQGKKACVLGRVSMDMIAVDSTFIKKISVGDMVTIIGVNGAKTLYADEISQIIQTSPYEVLTRINPLIYKWYK